VSARRGYTLVEVVVALAITALVMTALTGTVTASLRARAAAVVTLDRAAAVRTLLAHLERELTTALPEGFVVSADPQALRFTGGAEPGARLLYTLDGGTLVRRVEPRFAVADAVPGPPVAMLPGVLGFDVRILEHGEWTASWSGRVPPPAVRITLALDDGERFETVVPIPTGRTPARS
jgi:prepilin-type N-terminal cleavage/methylation domain-containing protein